jgi:uncharacterized protein YktB (UPF0637 family)
MSEVKTVTPEELAEVKELQDSYIKATYQIGESTIQKQDAQAALELADETLYQALQQLRELKEKEAKISTNLQQKYGSSTIDLTTGNIVS